MTSSGAARPQEFFIIVIFYMQSNNALCTDGEMISQKFSHIIKYGSKVYARPHGGLLRPQRKVLLVQRYFCYFRGSASCFRGLSEVPLEAEYSPLTRSAPPSDILSEYHSGGALIVFLLSHVKSWGLRGLMLWFRGAPLVHLTRSVSSSENYPEVSEEPLKVVSISPSFSQTNSLDLVDEHQRTATNSDTASYELWHWLSPEILITNSQKYTRQSRVNCIVSDGSTVYLIL